MITFATESKSEYSTSARFFRCLFIRVWIFSLSKYFSISLQCRSRYGRWAPGLQSKHLRHPTNKGKHFTVATLAAPESVRLNVGLVCVETVFVLTFPLSSVSFRRLPRYIYQKPFILHFSRNIRTFVLRRGHRAGFRLSVALFNGRRTPPISTDWLAVAWRSYTIETSVPLSEINSVPGAAWA